MARERIPSYRGSVRLLGMALAGLTALLAGSLPGSRPDLRVPEPGPDPTFHDDARRFSQLGQDLVRQSPDGTWTLPLQHIEPRRPPLEGLTSGQVHQMLDRYPELLGPASIGKPNRGRLLNGVRLPPSPHVRIEAPENVWGTPALVTCLQRAVAAVQDHHAGTPALYVGDMSREQGGYLRGHRSHQAGLDADIGYYYLDEVPWYTKANERNLDVARTWTLVHALVTDCDVEYVFIDLRVQALLREHAEQQGADPEWLDALFSKGRHKPGIIRHTWGHQTHIHFRVFDDRAQMRGERVHLAKMWARMRRPSAWSR